MHPSARILLYLIAALALPGLSFLGLAVMAGICLPALRGRTRQITLLCWRARWLFLLLGLGYAYSLPGPAVLQLPCDCSPSWPGVMAGLWQMARLLLLLWLLDMLVISQGSERMMAGLYGIFRGLVGVGLPAERAAVRIGLTLQAMEDRVTNPRGLSALLLDNETVDKRDDGELFLLRRFPWRGIDTVLVTGALAGMGWAWLA